MTWRATSARPCHKEPRQRAARSHDRQGNHRPSEDGELAVAHGQEHGQEEGLVANLRVGSQVETESKSRRSIIMYFQARSGSSPRARASAPSYRIGGVGWRPRGAQVRAAAAAVSPAAVPMLGCLVDYVWGRSNKVVVLWWWSGAGE